MRLAGSATRSLRISTQLRLSKAKGIEAISGFSWTDEIGMETSPGFPKGQPPLSRFHYYKDSAARILSPLKTLLSVSHSEDGHIAVVSQQALLVEGAQNRGSKVRDLHMEQLGHVGRRRRG
ncbi:hypothetical protein F7725_015523, partial [Dissostichus mawsoni]